jgi:hypothetical protein
MGKKGGKKGGKKKDEGPVVRHLSIEAILVVKLGT